MEKYTKTVLGKKVTFIVLKNEEGPSLISAKDSQGRVFITFWPWKNNPDDHKVFVKTQEQAEECIVDQMLVADNPKELRFFHKMSHGENDEVLFYSNLLAIELCEIVLSWMYK